MHLQAQGPGITSQHQGRQFFMRKHGNAFPFSIVGLSAHLGQSILPAVEKHVATGTVGQDQIRGKGLHRFKLNAAVRQRITTIFLQQIMPETKTTAMPTLRVIHHLSPESLRQARQNTRELSPSETTRWKYFSVMTAYMIHHAQRLLRLLIE